jgi:hypothetical protein
MTAIMVEEDIASPNVAEIMALDPFRMRPIFTIRFIMPMNAYNIPTL